MKNIAFYNVHEGLNMNNFMFENSHISVGDDLLAPMLTLRQLAETKGINVATVDVMSMEETDAFVFLDMPDFDNKYIKYARQNNIPMYLVLNECEIVRKSNYDKKNHQYFSKIFTHNDSLVDNKKYFKSNLTQTITSDFSKKPEREKLCVLIAGNKMVKHPLELYSKRIEAIRWFEQNHPDDFDLYGIGWDEYTFKGPRIVKALNRIRPLKKLFGPNYPSYRGRIERKRDVLEKYKFSICYENARDIPGYITEKVFDCFKAGCVPVYWGPDNVTDHIPGECFIDKRKFGTYEALYDFMINMNDNDYMGYLENIESYLNSDKAYPFSSEYFAETILREILND